MLKNRSSELLPVYFKFCFCLNDCILKIDCNKRQIAICHPKNTSSTPNLNTLIPVLLHSEAVLEVLFPECPFKYDKSAVDSAAMCQAMEKQGCKDIAIYPHPPHYSPDLAL